MCASQVCEIKNKFALTVSNTQYKSTSLGKLKSRIAEKCCRDKEIDQAAHLIFKKKKKLRMILADGPIVTG